MLEKTGNIKAEVRSLDNDMQVTGLATKRTPWGSPPMVRG
jgi:hypothetical protein